MSKLLRFLVTAALLAILAWRLDWPAVGQAFARLRMEFWLLGVGCLLAAQLASAKRWQLFAREMRFDASAPTLLRYYLIGMYFNLVLPTSVGGDVIRMMCLNGQSRRKLAAFASVALDRLSGLAVLIVLACLGVACSTRELPAWVSLSVWGSAGAAALGGLSLPLLQHARWLSLERRAQVQTILSILRAPRVLLPTTLLSLIVQVANVLMVWLAGCALDVPIPFAYYWILVPMVSLLTLLPVSVNGMGVREGATALFLTPLGVEQAAAITLALLWFAAHVSVSLLGGVVYLWGGPARATLPSQEQEAIDHGRSFSHHPDQGREGQSKQAA